MPGLVELNHGRVNLQYTALPTELSPDNSPVGDLNTWPSRPRRAVLPAELTEDIIANPDRLELPQTDLETVMLPLHQGLKKFYLLHLLS